MSSTSIPSTVIPPTPYIGRFAPSPTGPLHFGSLVSALASYLHARAHQGQWLVRMEDLDPPREEAGAAEAILASLERHELHWDGPVMFQSQRLGRYREVLAALRDAQLVYPCTCTRADLRAMGGVYNGHCRRYPADTRKPHALRLKLYDLPDDQPSVPELCRFQDVFQGPQTQNLREDVGDQIVLRKDGLFSYQLAVVVDDIAQGITHIIRGSDLLEVSARQHFLFELWGTTPPVYGHVPIAVNARGDKLSKQTRAPALNDARAGANLWHALAFLGQKPPTELLRAPAAEVLAWGLANWRTHAVQGLQHRLTPKRYPGIAPEEPEL